MKDILKKIIAQFGYQTSKKQIIILSDDWGSVRLKSLQARESLQNKGIKTTSSRFDTYDCLESNKDLELLFEILSKHKDYLGNPVCITAVTNVANPNFQAIKESNFTEYFFEKNTETYKRYTQSDNVYNLTKEGITEKIFIPSSHAREHVQVNWWMNELQNENSVARKVFDDEFFFLAQPNLLRKDINGLGAALNAIDANDFSNAKDVTKSALQLFEEIYGFKSIHFCPPAYFYPTDINNVLEEQRVNWLDVPRLQSIPRLNKKPLKRFRYLGQKSSNGFRYLVRNAVFESNMSNNNDGVESCLADIQQAFDCKQPAIISNHRASFVGGIEDKNREKGLKALDKLLAQIIKKWPDVEFISINELGK